MLFGCWRRPLTYEVADMPSLKLTQQIIPSLLPLDAKDTFYWDTELTGFAVKVTAQGQRSFIVQARIQVGMNKKRIRLNDCARMTVKEAREEARKLLSNMGLGQDPITERKKVELAGLTLRKALEDRIAVRRLKPKTAADYRALASNAFPDWLDKPISVITGQMAIDRHRDITRKSGPAQANYALRVLSAAFGHARGAHGLDAVNPVTRLREGKLFNKIRPRDGFVEPHELPALLTTLRRMELARFEQDRMEKEAAKAEELSWRGMRSRLAQAGAREADNMLSGRLHYSGAADLVRVLLLTGFRLEEAQGLRWGAVNLDQKVITLTDNKANRTLRMPMCGALVALMDRRANLLRRADGSLPEWVFQTSGEGRYRSLSTRVMPDLSKAVSDTLGKPFHIHAHKLRHTFATYLRALGFSEWTVAGLLNHSRTSSVTTLYAAPMTQTMHRIVNDLEAFIMSALEGGTDEGMHPAELLTGSLTDFREIGQAA